MGEQGLVVGSVFGTAEPPSNSIRAVFTNTMRIEVVEINSNEQYAKIRIIHDPAFVEPSLDPGTLFGGIAKRRRWIYCYQWKDRSHFSTLTSSSDSRSGCHP